MKHKIICTIGVILILLAVTPTVLISLKRQAAGDYGTPHYNFFGQPVFPLTLLIVTAFLLVAGAVGAIKYFSKGKNQKKKSELKDGEFYCAECMKVIKSDESKCPHCGWTWNKE